MSLLICWLFIFLYIFSLSIRLEILALKSTLSLRWKFEALLPPQNQIFCFLLSFRLRIFFYQTNQESRPVYFQPLTWSDDICKNLNNYCVQVRYCGAGFETKYVIYQYVVFSFFYFSWDSNGKQGYFTRCSADKDQANRDVTLVSSHFPKHSKNKTLVESSGVKIKRFVGI